MKWLNMLVFRISSIFYTKTQNYHCMKIKCIICKNSELAQYSISEDHHTVIFVNIKLSFFSF